MSRQLSSGLASSVSAMIPAASGAEADVPVWPSVQLFLRSVVIIWRSSYDPLLNVEAIVDEHDSEYHGICPFCVALLTEIV